MDFTVFYILFSIYSLSKSQSTTQCSLCTCIYIEPMYILDCENAGIHQLPELDYSIAKLVSKAYLAKNHLTMLDTDILSSWSMLEYIDLSHNSLKCKELSKIQPNVRISTDCGQEIGKYINLYFIFIILFLFIVYLFTDCGTFLNLLSCSSSASISTVSVNNRIYNLNLIFKMSITIYIIFILCFS